LKKVILSTLVTLSAFSAEFKIKTINKELGVVSISSTDVKSVNKDDLLEVEGKKCSLKVLEKRENSIIASINDCNIDELKKGEDLQVTNNVNGFEKAKTIIAKGDNNLSKNESWYVYWALGPSSITYDNPTTEEAANELKNRSDTEHLSMGLDLGFYFPLRENIMHGFAINGAADSYTVGAIELSIYQYLYAYSVQKFFGDFIGDGWFIRGDVGLVKYRSEVSGYSTNYSASSDTGFGLLFGGGYSYPLSDENRVLFNLNYAIRNAEDERVDTFAFTIGFLH